MPIDQTCSTCRHFHPTNTGHQGQCRRYPTPVLKDKGYGCGEWMTRSDPLRAVLKERERAAKVTGPTELPVAEPPLPAPPPNVTVKEGDNRPHKKRR